jgi:hypothetical protein
MRVVQAKQRIIETGPNVVDPKVIPMGAIGTVEREIVPGKSAWVNFGRTLGTVPVSENMLVDLPTDADKLVEYLRQRRGVVL